MTGQVNTENSPVDYYEYGPASTFASEPLHTAEVSLLASETPLAAPAQLTGLKPSTEYHFRLVVNGEGKAEEGGEETFTTLPVESPGLPDERGYELVTPVQNYHAAVYAPNAVPGIGEVNFGFVGTSLPFQAAANGDAVVYESDPTTSGNGYTGTGLGNAQLATRSSEGGWTQAAIEPTSSYLTTGTYQGFSSDLSVGVLHACDEPVLTSDAPVPPGSTGTGENRGYSILYTRNNMNGDYSPLFTTRPLNRPPSEKGKFGAAGVAGTEGEVSECNEALVYAGASGNFKQLLFEADDSLLEGEGKLEKELAGDVKQEIKEEKASNDLYVSVDGKVELVNVLPDGTPAPNATFGAEGPDFSHVISTDGSRIFWTDLNSGVVYARENGTSTIPVSQGPARFWTASSDGKYVLYTEDERLYRFDVERETREELAGAGAGVHGVIGASEDGSHVYFVGEGALTPDATSHVCVAESREYKPGELPETPNKGCNLYVSEPDPEHAGQQITRLVGVLAPEDDRDWLPAMGERTAEVTPDGSSVVFMSQQRFTGYDNLYIGEGRSGKPAETPLQEVFVYENSSGKLSCASCDPTGQPPAGLNQSGYLSLSWSNTYMKRSISTDGSRVFFDSGTALLPQDTDGAGDVYEWEHDGSGSCSSEGGCQYLLSGGDSTGGSLIDASENGNDVFFVSIAQLVPQDYGNEVPVVYDARVGGRTVSPPECTGTGCQGLPAPPPLFATPSSVTFDGVGNFLPATSGAAKAKQKAKPLTRAQKLGKALKKCHGKPRKQRASCEAKAKKTYGALKKAKKTSRSAGKGSK